MLLRGCFGGLPSRPLAIGGEWFQRDDWWFDSELRELPGSLGCVADLDVRDPMASGSTSSLRPFKLPTLGVGSIIVGEGFRRDDWWFDCVLGELPGSLGCVPDLDVPDPMVLGPTLRLRPYILPTRGAG